MKERVTSGWLLQIAWTICGGIVTASVWNERELLGLSGCGLRESASAAALFLPGLYFTVKLNCESEATHL